MRTRLPLPFLLPLLLLLLVAPGCQEQGQTEIARGNILASRGQVDEAAAAYRAAADRAPRDATPRLLLGNLLADHGRADEARAAFEDALRVDPKALEAKLGLARLHVARGEIDPAIALLSEVIDADQGNLYALLSRAQLSLRRGGPTDVERALQDTARAMMVDERNASVLYTRGLAFLAAGKPDEASEAFRLLGKAHPRSPLSSYGLAKVAASRGDLDGALAALKESREKAGGMGPTAWKPEEVRQDPSFVRLREHPQFSAVVDGP